MSLVFIDGFDHYATADILKKWDKCANCSINTNYSAHGTSCMYINGAQISELGKNLNNLQTVVVGFRFRPVVLSNNTFLRFMDGSSIQVQFGLTENGEIAAYRNDTLLGTSSGANIKANDYQYLEFKAYIHDTAGTIEVKAKGGSVLSLSSIDTKNTANAYITSVNFYEYYTLSFYMDDFYIDDADFQGDVKVETIYPSGAGTTTSWDASTGSNYECVDEATQNGDTDYISTATADEIDTYTMGDLTTTVGTVKGIQTNIIARKDDAGTRSIAPVLRPASTDRIGTTINLSDSYVDYMQIYNTNPEDSGAWELADINGLEVGVKLIS